MAAGSKAMFGFEPYHILLAAVGVAIIAAYWLPRFLSGREPAASALLVLLGMATFAFVPGLPPALSPLTSPRIWEFFAELCVIIGLFGTGLRIDRVLDREQWRPTLRLLLIAMPLTIAALTLFGWFAAGMTLAGGLLLGAILSPTDPVLAGDVQVGPPLEGGEHPVRYALTTEAGLNDGLAFPFVHLGILVAAAGGISAGLIGHWLWLDVAYRIAVGAGCGFGIGWLAGMIMFDWPGDNPLSQTRSGVIAFASVLATYGLTEVLEGYGFIAVFVAGLVLRREETEDRFHRQLHDFSESLEHTLTAILLVALGAALPGLWPYLDWSHALIGLALIFLIRPLLAWGSLHKTGLSKRERIVTAFYGVRGIGSVYYLAYASHHIELVNEETLWATVAFTIVVSTVVHGLTAGIAVEQATQDPEARPDPAAPQKS
ncbi:sodium:proton antiporter [Altererythrobacter sp. HHU K3-1]|uniref:Sodium:proton antiporter n=2 Tax=Qipengyuania atrilutea TaxID=2744473 RepID=A0A850H186_9SPHN|nr:sodium:proton antiporter [Actirhodobacter atriluteus]